MAEYIDRKKYMKDKYNCDLIQIDNVELVPLYQIIDKLEQSIERSKIDKAIGDMNNIDLNKYADNSYQLVNECIEILERNIGESKEIE